MREAVQETNYAHYGELVQEAQRLAELVLALKQENELLHVTIVRLTGPRLLKKPTRRP